MDPVAGMMNGSTMEYIFTDDKLKVDLLMMNGMMRMQTITLKENLENSYMLMDMLGKKYKLIELKLEKLNEQNMLFQKDITSIEYNKKDKKKILGYNCYKAVAKQKRWNRGQILYLRKNYAEYEV